MGRRRLIPQINEPLAPSQAVRILESFEVRLRQILAAIDEHLTARGYPIHVAMIMTTHELVSAWPIDLPDFAVAHVYYGPTATSQREAIAIRIEKATGYITLWDRTGVLDDAGISPELLAPPSAVRQMKLLSVSTASALSQHVR